jgi:membrane fusion protein (multidrug efflux system)
MATISTLDPIWIYCNVSEVSVLKASAEVQRTGKRISDAPVSLILADGSVHSEKGKIVFIDRAVDIKTGTLRVRAEYRNPAKVLRPGMFARAKVDLGIRPDSILVPQRAVQELQGKNFVWVVGEGNKASQRPIKAGERFESDWLIEEGLKAGERIIVEGLQKVREGAVVVPMTAAEITQKAAATAPSETIKEKE